MEEEEEEEEILDSTEFLCLALDVGLDS